jgi:hypothetical protein
MVKRFALLALAVALVAWPAQAPAAPADSPAAAKLGKARAELKMKAVFATYAEGQVTVTFTLENRGTKKAKPTQTWIRYFKEPTKVGPVDVGFVPTPAIRRGRSKTITATFPADRIPSGEVAFLACADFDRILKQRNTQNDCKYGPPTSLPEEAVVSYAVNDQAAGTVSGTATYGGCGFVAPGPQGTTGYCWVRPGGTVTLTASPAPTYFFASWAAASGKVCNGSASGPQLTLTSPTTAQDCVANFQHNP